MKLYYFYQKNHLRLYSNKEKSNLIAEIYCKAGDNLLLTIEDYFKENNINYEFNELIPLC